MPLKKLVKSHVGARELYFIKTSIYNQYLQEDYLKYHKYTK